MAQALATPVLPSLSLISNHISNSYKLSLSFPSSFPKVGGLSIKCARVGGVEIPNNKRVEYSLQYIHGIGRTSARQILNDLNFDNKLTKDFSEEELTTLREEVSKYMIEGDLVMFGNCHLECQNSSYVLFDSLVIAKMDGTTNEHPRAKSDGFPTILFFPAGNKSFDPITFEDDRTVVAFYKFLKKHASIPFKLQKPASSERSAPSETAATVEDSSSDVKDEL